jgi:hypothetical protein
MTPQAPIRVAIVGCGAVARQFHVPCAARVDGLRITAFVDPVAARAQLLASYHGTLVPESAEALVTTTIDEVVDFIDAAIVAVPHSEHAQMAARLLTAGRHVLVEKPLALSVAEDVGGIGPAQDDAGGRQRRVGEGERHAAQDTAQGIAGYATRGWPRDGSLPWIRPASRDQVFLAAMATRRHADGVKPQTTA